MTGKSCAWCRAGTVMPGPQWSPVEMTGKRQCGLDLDGPPGDAAMEPGRDDREE